MSDVSVDAAAAAIDPADRGVWTISEDDSSELLRDFLNAVQIAFRNSEDESAIADASWTTEAQISGAPAGAIFLFLQSRGVDAFISEVKRQCADIGLSWEDACEASQVSVLRGLERPTGFSGGGWTHRGTWVPPTREPEDDWTEDDHQGFATFTERVRVEPTEMEDADLLLAEAVQTGVISFGEYGKMDEMLQASDKSEADKAVQVATVLKKRVTAKVGAQLGEELRALPTMASGRPGMQWDASHVIETMSSDKLEDVVKGRIDDSAIIMNPFMPDRFGLPNKNRALFN